MASTLIKSLSGMGFNSSKGIHDHIMEIRDIAAQLKSLEVKIADSFLVHCILNSLPIEYGSFKIFYNTRKEKWSINRLLTIYIQEKGRLK